MSKPWMIIPAEEYHATKRLSKSLISDYKSPAHLYLKMNEPQQRKQAFDEGQAFHTFILEPDKFMERVAIKPTCDRRSNENKAIHAKFEADNASKAWITQEYYEGLIPMREAIRNHEVCRDLFASGMPELSFFWTDGFGLEWKMRTDWITPDGDSFIIADLKKTGKGADPETFRKEIANHRYHWQHYIYREGFIANMGKVPRFLFVAVEDTAPYAVNIFELDDTWLEAAGRSIEPIRYQLAEYKDVPGENWPAYSPVINTINAPAWA